MLKALVIRNKLDSAKHELEKFLEGDNFATRQAELETAVAELTVDSTDEERSVVSDAVEKLEEERNAFEAKRAELEKVISDTEAELRDAEEEMPPEEEKEPEKIEERKMEMNIDEIRSSKEYIDAFARYIKTEKDDEVRALLSTNATTSTGYVPVPTIIEDRIRTNWAKLGIMDAVRKTYIKGNLKVGFELSADEAVVHAEGASAPSEESLTLGVVELVPKSIKKWISISDESLDLTGESFLYYVYDELTYQIAKKAQKDLLALVTTASTSASTTAVSVAEIDDGAPTLSIVAECVSNLSDEADNPVIVMNKGTMAKFEAARVAGNFASDPYFGLPVYYDNSLPVYSTTATTGTWLVVGDFGRGAQANFPSGEEIGIKFDDLSLAEKDLVKLVGRQYVGLGLVSDKCFCRVTMHT